MLHCKTGVRSAEALAAVKQAGFKDAVHVQGGVTAWATRIDKTPSRPTDLPGPHRGPGPASLSGGRAGPVGMSD